MRRRTGGLVVSIAVAVIGVSAAIVLRERPAPTDAPQPLAADLDTGPAIHAWLDSLNHDSGHERYRILSQEHKHATPTIDLTVEARADAGCHRDRHELFFVLTKGAPSILEDKTVGSSCCPGVGDCWSPQDAMVELSRAAAVGDDERMRKAVGDGPPIVLSACFGSLSDLKAPFGKFPRRELRAADFGAGFLAEGPGRLCESSVQPTIRCVVDTLPPAVLTTDSRPGWKGVFVWERDSTHPRLQSASFSSRSFPLGGRCGEY